MYPKQVSKIIAGLLFCAIIILVVAELGKKARTQTQVPCTQPEVVKVDDHHVITVLGAVYKVTRIPGGEWEIVGKLERFK